MTKTAQITPTDWEQNLSSIIRARQPGIFVQTVEEERAVIGIRRTLAWLACEKAGVRELVLWSTVQVQTIELDSDKREVEESLPLFGMLQKFQERLKIPDSGSGRYAVLVLADVEKHLDDPGALRLLRETLWAIRKAPLTVILIGKPFNLPEEIAALFTVLPFELPTVQDLNYIIGHYLSAYKDNPRYKDFGITENFCACFARACAGLTELEARSLLGLAVSRYQAFDDRAIQMALQEKAQIVRRANLLEYRTPQGGLDMVGGLENLKSWIKSQDTLLADSEAARAYGLSMPKGVILTGVPGVGKSLTAEMLAAHWKLPLLKFDVGRIFGSLVGESESNLRQVFSLCEAIRPCVLYLDEFEKALGGDGDRDGGTSSRVKGSFMSWLQDKPEDIFVIATLNDITRFINEPAMLRAGRFDAVFFCDLPDLRSRLEILSIHFRKRNHHLPADNLMAAAHVSQGYSGAELETVVQTALRSAFNERPRFPNPSSEQLVQAVRSIKPLSQTMKESIRTLRQFCLDGRAIPAGATLEDDEKLCVQHEQDRLNELGLPDILKG